ncbi:13189_t:CDS:2, partial [Gigaspora margarita]
MSFVLILLIQKGFSGYKAKEGQRSIYNFFKPINNQLGSDKEETEWDSDIYNNMDNNDLLQIDETDEIEKSTWQIDQNSNAVHAKMCSGIAKKGSICNKCHYIQSDKMLCNRIIQKMLSLENIKFTPKFYWYNSSLKNYLQNIDLYPTSNPWIILAIKAINRAFKDLPIFLGLCKMITRNKAKQNIKYNEAFTNFLVILGSISPRALDLFHQNLEGKNNTKLKPQLKYSSTLQCIIGSVLSKEETHISIYSDIPNVIGTLNHQIELLKQFAHIFY